MEKIVKKILNLKIRDKLFICYLFVTMIPLFSITGITYFRTLTLLKEQSYNNILSNLKQMRNSISENLKIYYNLLEIIDVNPYIQNYISMDYSNIGYEEMYFFINNMLKGIMLTNPSIENICIYSENETLPQDEYYFRPIDEKVVSSEWYKKANQFAGKAIYGEFIMEENGESFFTVVRRINRHNPTAPKAIIAIKINTDQIKSYIVGADNSTQYFITDNKGTVISVNHSQYIGESLNTYMDFDTLEGYNRQTIRFDYQEMIATSVRVENGWRCIALVPFSKFLKEALKSSMHVVGIFITFSVVAAVSNYMVSYALSKKTKMLIWGVNEIRNGAFGVSLPHKGNDEIGELVEAFNEMSTTISNLIYEVYQKELMQKQSELNLLQEQVNPHFLYNSLASISSLALRNKDDETYEMVKLLSDFYRISLNGGKSKLTIKDEINLTKCYVKIQKVRFRDKVDVFFEVDEALLECKTLKLILQPIIENSISHGIYDEAKKLIVHVKVLDGGESIKFIISDNGKGFDETVLKSLEKDILDKTEGFGLKNISIRIKLFYNEKYGIVLKSKPFKGMEAVVTIPKEY